MKATHRSLIKQLPTTLAALASLTFVPQAYSADTISEALSSGKTNANLRYRYETVNDTKTATASTVRLRLAYETADFKGLGAKVEFEHLTSLGGQNYNSKANGQTAYSVIADPEFTEVNQAYLSYSGIPDSAVKYGRQKIVLDNQRFIGNVGWRQNEQTYDALSVVNKSLPDTQIMAAYISNVNRIFSNNALATSGAAAGNFAMQSSIVNVNYKGLSAGEIVGYSYMLDFSLPANAGNSSKTYGLRFKGKTSIGDNTLHYTAEAATQSNYANNPSTYTVSYSLLEGGVDFKPASVKLGYEVLGSNGSKAFSTPLATLHAFNGWVDMFLGTPATGLTDSYVSASTKLAGVKMAAVYHNFSAASGSVKYGTELDLVLVKVISKQYLVGAKYGSFATQSAPTRADTNKLWLTAQAKF